jgi:hypothetical protein
MGYHTYVHALIHRHLLHLRLVLLRLYNTRVHHRWGPQERHRPTWRFTGINVSLLRPDEVGLLRLKNTCSHTRPIHTPMHQWRTRAFPKTLSWLVATLTIFYSFFSFFLTSLNTSHTHMVKSVTNLMTQLASDSPSCLPPVPQLTVDSLSCSPLVPQLWIWLPVGKSGYRPVGRGAALES